MKFLSSKKTVAAVTVLLTLAVMTMMAQPCCAEQWYFKKTDDHSVPPADEMQSEAVENGAFYTAPCADDDRVIYLTFDAGYENGNVAKIVDVLQKHNATAAFFVLEHFVRDNPELVQKMDIIDCLVCNHTCTHRDMATATRAEFEEELHGLEQVSAEVTQVPIAPFYRPPEGSFTDENIRWAKEMGYTTVFWSFAYADWDNDHQPDPETALKNIEAHSHSGEILLLHPTSATNAEILDRLLTDWEKEGYRFGSLAELTGEHHAS